jgi:hypothetical protein
MPTMLTDDEVALLDACEDPRAWNAAVAQIKKAHGGYPPDWYERVLAPGGVRDRLKDKWGDPHALEVGATVVRGAGA